MGNPGPGGEAGCPPDQISSFLSQAAAPDRDELAEAIAEQLVARWGVIFRDLEHLAVPWREILWALRRMEARGSPRNGETITIPAADPLNLTGIVLPGPRIPAIGAGTVTYTDGAVPAASTEPISEPA